jgi:GNAT superfamily N-acetyltransferase
MRYELTTLLDGAEKCKHLFPDAMAEAGFPGRSFAFQETIYRALDAGESFGVIAWDEGEVAGFVSVFISIATHFDGVVGSNDVLYVVPKYRNTLVPGRLMVFAEREAKRRGAITFDWAANNKTSLDESLSKRPLVYRLSQKHYLKEL